MRSEADLTAAAELVAWFFQSGEADRQTPDTVNNVMGVDAALAWALGEGAPVNPVAEMLFCLALGRHWEAEANGPPS